MKGFRALAGGVAGGVIGVVLWASVTYFIGYEIGWVAWLVGVLTGAGASTAIEKRGGILVGMLACLIAIGTVGVGKFALARLEASEAIANIGNNFTDEDAVLHMARTEPQSASSDDGADDAAALDRAAARWESMSETERDAYRLQAANQVRQEMEANAEAVTLVTLARSLSPYDLVWIGLAGVSAFKLGSRNNEPRRSTFIQNVADKEGGLHPAFKGSSEAESMCPASFGGVRGLPSAPAASTPRFAPGAELAISDGHCGDGHANPGRAACGDEEALGDSGHVSRGSADAA